MRDIDVSGDLIDGVAIFALSIRANFFLFFLVPLVSNNRKSPSLFFYLFQFQYAGARSALNDVQVVEALAGGAAAVRTLWSLAAGRQN
jgi:hypothetical protein